MVVKPNTYQEAHDIAMGKITEKEYDDPFKGSK